VNSQNSLDFLFEALRRLPGVGPKSAQRIAYHLLQHDREGAALIGRALLQAVEEIQHCSSCNTFTEQTICATCLDQERDSSLLCVVETPSDQFMIEQTLTFKGRYFVLMGRLSPLDGIGPKDIHMENYCNVPAMERCRKLCSPQILIMKAKQRRFILVKCSRHVVLK